MTRVPYNVSSSVKHVSRKIQPYNTTLLQKAIIRWRGFDDRSQLTVRDFHEFAQFIGYPHQPQISLIVDTTKEEVRRIIDLINGENGNTILKMLEARNQNE